jgi:NAD(P)-dependent dehydrogenase (short-subunit alcohol dehydrogenase family)
MERQMPRQTSGLHQRTAVVTGGAGWIGQAICAGLSDAGATVIVLDKAVPNGEGPAMSPDWRVLDVDVTSADALGAVAAELVVEFGAVDILVNCAGIGGRAPARDYDIELFRRIIEVNVLGTFLACQVFGRGMLDVARGSIVNVSSVGAIVGMPGSVGYQASKGAVSQITRALAVEWAPHGVRVNAIAPGHTRTPLVERQWESEPGRREYFESRTPMGRLPEASDMVGAVLYLASDAAAMVTGQILAIDGGFTVQ